jgi:hypothetical protein
MMVIISGGGHNDLAGFEEYARVLSERMKIFFK